MFSYSLSHHSFNNLEDMLYTLDGYKIINRDFPLTNEVYMEGKLLHIDGDTYEMSDVFPKSLFKLLKLPNKNLQVLDLDHLTSDINYRFQTMILDGELHAVFARFINGYLYDIYPIKKDKVITPIKHSVLLKYLFQYENDLVLPILQCDNVYKGFVDTENGMWLKTENPNFGLQLHSKFYGDLEFKIGTFVNNIEYNKSKYGVTTSYNITRSDTTSSILGVNRRLTKVNKEGADYLSWVSEEVRFLYFNINNLYKALKLANETLLTEQVVLETMKRVKKVIGTKNTESLFIPYLQDDKKGGLEFNPDSVADVTELEFILKLQDSMSSVIIPTAYKKVIDFEHAIGFALNQNLYALQQT